MPDSRLTIADIRHAVQTHFGLSKIQMLCPCRRRRYAVPRQIAMTLARELTKQTLPAIGMAFGGRDHTTVLAAMRAVQGRAERHRMFALDLAYLRRSVAALAAEKAAARLFEPCRDQAPPSREWHSGTPGQIDSFGPGRLWSLWKMLEAAGVPIWRASRVIAEFKALMDSCAKDMGATKTFATVELDGEPVFGSPLEIAARTPPTIDVPDLLPMVGMQMDRLTRLIQEDAKIGEIAAAINELQNRAEDELKTLWFYLVPRERFQYCMLAMPFGAEINDRFPAAIDDIEGASRCLGLGQGTACVLHLMRVMEVGLEALALSLKIPYAPNWGSYLTQIGAKIAAKHETKGVQWKRDESFYRDVSGDLITVKTAWRNPTMHVGRKYSADEAEEIFRAVKGFMYRLATSGPTAKAGAQPA